MRRFECKPDCGKCCSMGENQGYVFLTPGDLKVLEINLGVKKESFAKKASFDWTRAGGGKREMWYLKDSEKTCVFLENKKCTVYDARPTQCRTFPFWPEYVPQKKWEELKTFCPGIDEGLPVDPLRGSLFHALQGIADKEY